MSRFTLKFHIDGESDPATARFHEEVTAGLEERGRVLARGMVGRYEPLEALFIVAFTLDQLVALTNLVVGRNQDIEDQIKDGIAAAELLETMTTEDNLATTTRLARAMSMLCGGALFNRWLAQNPDVDPEAGRMGN